MFCDIHFKSGISTCLENICKLFENIENKHEWVRGWVWGWATNYIRGWQDHLHSVCVGGWVGFSITEWLGWELETWIIVELVF